MLEPAILIVDQVLVFASLCSRGVNHLFTSELNLVPVLEILLLGRSIAVWLLMIIPHFGQLALDN